MPCFDDLLVLSLGVEWRAVRSSSTKAQWKELSQECVDLICQWWGLPPNPCQPPKAGTMAQGVVARQQLNPAEQKTLAYDNCFPETGHPNDGRWIDDRSRFLCTIDNKSVADILNGKACVQNDEMKPLFQRMSTRILSLVENFDLRPPKDWDDPVEWRPRRYNRRSDQICNLLLDGQEGFHMTGENTDVVLQLKPHFLVQTDGGCRYHGSSAIAYVIYGIIYGYDTVHDYYTIALGGERIAGNWPSFNLEAQALDMALEKLTGYLLAAGWERGNS